MSEILVQEGDKVKAGDVLVRLDPTMAAANQGIVTKGLYDALAQKVRLEAERSGATELVFPPEYVARATTDPQAAEAIRTETNAFEAGVAALTSKTNRNVITPAPCSRAACHANETERHRQRTLSVTRAITLLRKARPVLARRLIVPDQRSNRTCSLYWRNWEL